MVQELFKHEKMGIATLIGLHPLLQFFLKLFLHLMPFVRGKIILADTPQEAESLLVRFRDKAGV
jgi:hypothetical protein